MSTARKAPTRPTAASRRPSGSTRRAGGSRAGSSPLSARGTAARRDASRPAAPRGPARPQVRSTAQVASGLARRVRRDPLARRRLLVLGLIVVFLSVLLVPTLRNYLQQRAQIEALNQQVTRQQEDVRALREERERWNDPEHVARQARERLGFAKPGERSYIIVDEQQQAREAGADGTGQDPAAADRPWYGRLWGSLLSAARAEDSPAP